NRMHHNGFGQRELLFALDDEVDHRVRAVLTQDGGEGLGVDGRVLRIGLVAVQHGGDVTCAAGATGSAFAELGANGRFEKVDVGHDGIYSYGSSGLVVRRAQSRPGSVVYSSGEDRTGTAGSRAASITVSQKSAVTLAETTRTP